MNKLLLAGACALALSSAACTPQDAASITAVAATIAPNLPPAASVPQVLASAGASPAAQATVATNIARVQIAAANLCKIRPFASGILNVGIALSRDVATVANSAPGQAVRGVATIICDGLSTAPVYTALGRGQLVKATVTVNGIAVPVYGERL